MALYFLPCIFKPFHSQRTESHFKHRTILRRRWETYLYSLTVECNRGTKSQGLAQDLMADGIQLGASHHILNHISVLLRERSSSMLCQVEFSAWLWSAHKCTVSSQWRVSLLKQNIIPPSCPHVRRWWQIIVCQAFYLLSLCVPLRSWKCKVNNHGVKCLWEYLFKSIVPGYAQR